MHDSWNRTILLVFRYVFMNELPISIEISDHLNVNDVKRQFLKNHVHVRVRVNWGIHSQIFHSGQEL